MSLNQNQTKWSASHFEMEAQIFFVADLSQDISAATYQVNLTLGSSITSGNNITVQPSAMGGAANGQPYTIIPGSVLTIGIPPTQEEVTVLSATANTFTADFTFDHFPGESVTNIANPDAPSVFLDVVQFVSEFAINDIPSATLLIAVGRDANDISEVSTIHEHLQQVSTMLPIRVYLTATSIAGDPKPDIWPKGKFLIFEGYATGGSWKKTSSGCEYSLFLAHWLVDLSFSSAISRTVTPINPAQFSFWSTVPTQLQSGGNGRDFTASTSAAPFFSAKIVQDDFWGAAGPEAPLANWAQIALSAIVPESTAILQSIEYLSNMIAQAKNKQLSIGGSGLKRFFMELCAQDRLAFAPGLLTLQSSQQPNYEALRALRKMEPFGFDGVYQYGTKLSMNIPDIIAGPSVSDAIANDIATTSFETLSGYTIWDKLIKLASNYQFMVIPMIERTLCVPFNPAQRSYYRTIYDNNQDMISNQMALLRRIRGVAIFAGRSWGLSGGGLSLEGAANDLSGIGFFEAEPGNGLLLLKESPAWLASIVPTQRGTGLNEPFTTSISPQASSNSIASVLASLAGISLSPGAVLQAQLAGPTALAAAAALSSPSNIISATHPLLNAYAHATYCTEILRTRQATVSGKLRFDISVGSMVRVDINGLGDPFAAEGSIFNEELYAMVMKVTTALNAESGGANTSFQLAYIRNEKENNDPASVLVVDRHPLWGNSNFTGAPMLGNEPAFTIPDSCSDAENTSPACIFN